MKKVMSSVAIGALLLSLAGCGDEKVNTVEFYEKNDSAREATIKKCENANKLSAKEAADCQNAKRAQQLVGESMPMGLSGRK